MGQSDFEVLKTQIMEYLRDKVEDGDNFVKSHHVASDLDISVKRVGVAMSAIYEADDAPVTLTQWGGTSDGTTWYVDYNSEDNNQS